MNTKNQIRRVIKNVLMESSFDKERMLQDPYATRGGKKKYLVNMLSQFQNSLSEEIGELERSESDTELLRSLNELDEVLYETIRICQS